MHIDWVTSATRQNATRRDKTRRGSAHSAARKYARRAGGRRPAPPRAEPGGSAADWCRREDHAVARRTEWVFDGVTPPRFEIGT